LIVFRARKALNWTTASSTRLLMLLSLAMGFSGGVAAIEAADHMAKVLICEKMPLAGGLSICSGGAVRCASGAAGHAAD
jgi:hypothetical protein